MVLLVTTAHKETEGKSCLSELRELLDRHKDRLINIIEKNLTYMITLK